MPTPVDLNEVIEDSITDIDLPLEEPDLDTTSEDDLKTVEEPTTTDTEVEAAPETEVPAVEDSAEVKSPTAKSTEAKPADDFEKRFGIPKNSASGRENRIPHSRVQQMVAKADKETEKRVKGEYEPKLAEFTTKVKDYETKVADYEGRLTKVAEFEQVLLNDAPRFLTMLAGMPQYQAYLRPLFEPQAQSQPAEVAQAQEVLNPEADMPQPDEKLGDGTMVYSMAGLAKLNAWNRAQAAAQAKKEVLEDVNKRFGGMYEQWEQHQRIQQQLPKVQAQIAEARKWAQFNENEQEIIAALNADKTLSLEGAYNRVVVPKLVQANTTAQVDRTALEQELRTKILEEIKKTPRSTSAQTRATQPNSRPVSTGNRSLEEVIAESVKSLK